MIRKITILLLVTILLIFPAIGFSAQGDLIYENCAGVTCTGAGSNNGWVRTVETNGCYSGNCLKLVGTPNTNYPQPAYGAGSTSINVSAVSGKNEITAQLYVKFNENPRWISGANIKALRAYTGGDSYTNCAYLINNLVGGTDVYVTHSPGSYFTDDGFDARDETDTYVGDTRFSLPNGDGTWRVGTAEIIAGKIGAGPYGTIWKKFTFWLKLPSTLGGSNGESKMWIDDTLIYHAYNQEFDGATQTTFSNLSFYPSSEASEAFEHWQDEMKIWDGYVPPGPQTPVDGQCNAAYDGGTFASLTASDPICTVGAVGSFISGPPTAIWDCLGTGGGASDNCSATITPDTCADNAALCSIDECASYYPTYSYCLNDTIKCHLGDCLSIGSFTNFNLYTQEECGIAGLFYWGGTCNTVEEPTNLTTGNLLINPNLLDWTSTLPANYTSYIPGNIKKTFLGARMFNGATLNPDYLMKLDTTYTVAYNLMSVQGSGKVWSYGYPGDYLSSAPGTIVYQFTTPSLMPDRKIYIGSGNESNVEANNFRLYESSNEIVVIPPGALQRFKIGTSFINSVTNDPMP